MVDNTALVEIGENEARLNVTWNGQNGDLVDPVPVDADDDTIRNLATEAIRSGYIAGIAAEENPDFSNYIVDRYPANETTPWPRCILRPKTPFGG